MEEGTTIQRGIDRKARKDADFQVFCLLRFSVVDEEARDDPGIGAVIALPPGAGLDQA
jgi:hypothetical protein